jgi:hypothetical protein
MAGRTLGLSGWQWSSSATAALPPSRGSVLSTFLNFCGDEIFIILICFFARSALAALNFHSFL